MFLKMMWFLVVFALVACQNIFAVSDIATVDNIMTKGPWTDVRAFGAKGDGKADDTASIQRTIDHVASTTQGIVFFPPGAYKISSRLKLARNVDLLGVGVGFGSQIIPFGTDGISIMGSDWPGGYGFRNHIKGLTIMMAQADTWTAIVIDHAYTIKIENVFVFNAGSGGGISIANTGHVTLADVSVYGLGKGTGTGIFITDSNVNLYNPDVEACFHGLRVQGDQGVHVFGGHFERNAGSSVRFERASYNTIIGAKISAPNAQGNTVAFLEGSSNNTVMGSRLDAHKTGFVLYQDTDADRQNVVTGSYLNGQVTTGIQRR